MNLPDSPSSPPETLRPGSHLAHYEIKLRLGVGGMGEVYLAHDPKLDRKVALKILPREFAANQENLRRFLREAKAAAAVNHQNIAHIYDISKAEIDLAGAGAIHYIAMEFIEGLTLRQHMNRTKMELGEALDISIQIAKAFAAAHAAGIIHRDIKPENVMRCEDGNMKVLDFGLAKLTEERPSHVEPEARTTPIMLTPRGAVLGTVAYMSPEQARGIEVDARTDIFSLGVVIYELLAGIVPFPGETPADQVAALLDKEPQPLIELELAPETSHELQRIVSTALRKDRDERYHTVKILLADLVDLKHEVDFAAALKRRARYLMDSSASPDIPTTELLSKINETLKDAMPEMGAISCTFYVKDPFWPDELHLIAMPGVRVREPMYGFAFPPHSKRVVAEGDLEIFSADTQFKKELREDAGWPLDRIDPATKFLFGDFVEREGIKSSARLTYAKNGHAEAVLFVNFAETTTFDDPLKEKLRGLLAQCVTNLEAVQGEVRALETDDLIQAIRMFPPTYQGSTGLYEWEQPLEDYFCSILGVAMAALELEPGTAFGTIHEYDRHSQTLRRVAHCGEINVERAESQSVATGEGIISWVAIRRKALLIRDLANSKFRDIHIPINLTNGKEVRSEVAIPIFAGEILLGVLNLESFLPNAFRSMCVRSLWFAVNRAAVAHKLSRINERIKTLIDRFLELCRETVHKGTGGFSLNRLADLAVEELEADRCGIWRYDELADKFEIAGISPADDRHQPPRPGGLSRFILQLFGELTRSQEAGSERSAWPVWISRKNDSEVFEIKCWNGESWAQPPAHLKPPQEINPSVSQEVKSLLGIPIKGRLNCIGIAWLEYAHDREKPLVDELMKLATGFADYAGMVIEFSQIDLVGQDAVQRIGAQLSEQLLATGPLDLKGFPSIEGYAISEPFPNSRIGGDFYAARVIDERTAVVLVGDGQGHAVTGALNMLPMLTTFEAFWKDSRSATHVMDKIMSISNTLSVRGTAVYCVFKVVGKNLWLSVTAAAHPHLVIIRKVGAEPYLHLPKNKSACAGMLGVPSLAGPIVEAHTELFSGDAIIIFSDGLNMDVDEVTQVGLSHRTEDSKSIAAAVFAKALEGSEPLNDDATVLVLRVK